MKKTFFFFAMLASVAVNAQSGVTVTPVSVTNKTVKFNVSWLNSSRTGRHNSKVWVFVDYRPIVNNAPSGDWVRAAISGTPTATSGTPTRETTTDKGFWLQGTSGTSGTYNATVTATLSNDVPAQFNWCALASDCPPNVSYNNGTYTLHGTPPFKIIAANGTTAQTVTGTTITASALTVTPVTMTDKTECPWGFCPYTGSDLYVNASYVCKLRTSGAQNWEAYIKDVQENQIYRIVQFSDNSWWFDQELATSNKRKTTCNNISMYDCNNKPNCPTGWSIPTKAQIINRLTNWTSDDYGTTFIASNVWMIPTCSSVSEWYRIQCSSDCTDLLCIGYGTNKWVHGNQLNCNSVVAGYGARIRCRRVL
ncbi:MAG: hypothetical protein LBB31_00405 [Prevotellaceae bacterium]|jgi:hypothetical protein|nr:hypothetical protein [Prevotellaceae bacterium]